MTRSRGAGSRATPSGVVVVRLGSDWGLDNERLAGGLPRHHRPTRDVWDPVRPWPVTLQHLRPLA